MTAPRRNLAEHAARYSPVYSYRFDTVPENATILTGVSLFPRLSCLYVILILASSFDAHRLLISKYVAAYSPISANPCLLTISLASLPSIGGSLRLQ